MSYEVIFPPILNPMGINLFCSDTNSACGDIGSDADLVCGGADGSCGDEYCNSDIICHPTRDYTGCNCSYGNCPDEIPYSC